MDAAASDGGWARIRVRLPAPAPVDYFWKPTLVQFAEPRPNAP